MSENKERTLAHIKTVSSILHCRLPENEKALRNSLRDAEGVFIQTIEEKAAAHRVLLQKRMQFRHPKDKEYTDFDRTILLEGNIAEHIEAYELFAGMEKALEQRISVIKALLVQ